jgi:hypothetical protein
VAIFHASTKSISRSAGRSAVAAIAYRTACRLVDERTGQVHDYTRKGGVLSTEILLPDGSSAERNALWNAAEAAEKRRDARTAREWVIALPSELDAQQRQELAVGFGIELATRYGVAVDLAIHAPDHEGDNRNHHAHILTTTRQVHRDESGALVLGKKAVIELSDRDRRALGLGAIGEEIKAVRQLWEQTANRALEQAGRAERIDARSLKAQGIDREATRHMGPSATEMERRGIQTDRGDLNRQAAANNQERAQLVAEVIDLQAQRQRRDEERQEARREAAAAQRQKARDARDKAREERIAAGVRELEAAAKDWLPLQPLAPQKLAQKPVQQAATPAQPVQAQPTPQKAVPVPSRPPVPAQAPRQSRQSTPAPAAPRPPSPEDLQAQRERAERERIERMSIDELSQEIERLRPQGVALAVLEDEAVKAARAAQQELEDQIHNNWSRERWARDTAQMWRQSHPRRAWAHDAGMFRSEFLAEREGVEAEARRKRLEAETSLPAAKLKTETVRSETEQRILVEQAPIRAYMAKLQRVLDVKEERARVVSDFQELAANRAGQRFGWDDRGEEWQATPALLRELIDVYNQAPPKAQAAVLERLGRDPQASQQFKALLEQRQELVRQQQQDRGWSHGR